MPDSFIVFLIWLIPCAPLAAAVLAAMFGPRVMGEKSSWLAVAGVGLAALASLTLLAHFVAGGESIATGYEWINVGNLQISIDLQADAMTVLMLVTVTTVSFLVVVYSRGYMHGDPGYPRFFAEVALFVFSMCMLVLSSSFLMLFIFWEGVGVCSYLLIGFWYEKPSASAAAKKAFIVNRIGDFGFLIGLMLIWTTFGSLHFADVLNPDRIQQIADTQPYMISAICLLLLLGAMGKSAQFPLHVWLPDAMEGPTPVSALIHAATMVTAGVYLVARATPLFVFAPEVQLLMACIGGFTALLAALIALTQNDLKRVLAYSTVSQLGYMFLALGCAGFAPELATLAVTAAMFHLFTHAFFKALLFLGAGSVMHAMGNEIDMRKFGGLRSLMPRTHLTFLVGSAALAGVPLLSAFWSKDEILGVVAAGMHHEQFATLAIILLAAAVGTAGLTAFYTFRAYFRTFWGEQYVPAAAGHHAHESPASMTGPLIVLAVAAAFIGILTGPTHLYGNYLAHTQGLEMHEHASINWLAMGLGTLAAVVGIAVAWVMYGNLIPPASEQAQQPAPTNPLALLSYNKFYLDELFEWLIVKPFVYVGRLLIQVDRFVIDGLIDLLAAIPGLAGKQLRPVQNGMLPGYALGMAVGVIVLLIAVLAKL